MSECTHCSDSRCFYCHLYAHLYALINSCKFIRAALAALINLQESFHEMYRICTDRITEQRRSFLVFAGQIREDVRPDIRRASFYLVILTVFNIYTCFKIYTHYVCSQKSKLYDCLSAHCPVCLSSHGKDDFLLRQTIKFSESESESEGGRLSSGGRAVVL